MKETNHDYQNCIMGNFYNSVADGRFNSWNEFKEQHFGFLSDSGWDDTYHFIFRYDIYKISEELYNLEICMMFQRKGIYSHVEVINITQEELDKEITPWLKGRKEYLLNLWKEV